MFGFHDINEKSEKKEKILFAAEHLFAERGFGATSVRDIAKAAGVNIAMISYYFGSKEKLMETLFITRMEAGKQTIRAVANDKEKKAMQKLEEIMTGYLNRVFTHRDFYRLSIIEQIVNHNKTILSLYYKSKKEYADSILKIVEDGYRNGEFKYRCDNIFLQNLFNGFLLQTSINQNFYNTYHKKTGTLQDETQYQRGAAVFLLDVLKRVLGYDETK